LRILKIFKVVNTIYISRVFYDCNLIVRKRRALVVPEDWRVIHTATDKN
jgi:hypothetical protein